MTDSVLDVTADALEQAGAHPHRLVVRQHGQVVGRRRWAPWSPPASTDDLTVLADDEPVGVSPGLLERVCSDVENTVSHGFHSRAVNECCGYRRTGLWIVVTP